MAPLMACLLTQGKVPGSIPGLVGLRKLIDKRHTVSLNVGWEYNFTNGVIQKSCHLVAAVGFIVWSRWKVLSTYIKDKQEDMSLGEEYQIET